MKLIRNHKWAVSWSVFGMITVGFILYVVIHISKNDFNSALLQFGAILIPLFAAVIIMLQNNEQIDRSTKTQLDHLQNLNDREIDEMQRLFHKQIESLSENTNRQINEFRIATNEQIKALQENTTRQSETYIKETSRVVDELTDNSVLLAEILKREVEKAIFENTGKLQKARERLQKARSFQILRSEAEKQQEISEIEGSISWLEDWGKRLQKKHNQLEKIFGDLQ